MSAFYCTIGLDGRSESTHIDAVDVAQAARVLCAPTTAHDRRLIGELERAVDANRVHEAGLIAADLGLSFAWSPRIPPMPTYLVPIDPSEATNCESCQ